MTKRLSLAAFSIVALSAVLADAQQRSRLTGTVVDFNGDPVEGAVVVIENPDNMPARIEKTTNDKGRYTFPGLRPGSWIMSIEADGFHPYQGQFELGASENKRMDLEIERASGAALLATSEKVREEVREATRALEAGDFDRAVQLYRELLDKAPEVYQAHYNIALALEQKGDWAGAAMELEKYVEQEPENAEAILKLATALDRSGQTEKALPLYEKSAAMDPENAIAAFNLALAMFQTEKYEQAARHFRRSLEIDPGMADAHYMLGHVLLRQGDSAGARASYEKFLELAPDSPNADAAREAVEQLKSQ